MLHGDHPKTMKPQKIFVSRNYVEFGPFEAAEILDFHKRGIATNADHLHVIGTDTWITLGDWLAAQTAGAPSKTKTAPKPAAKQAARAPRKKAAKPA